jgi:DNA polymerase-1
MAEKKQNVLLLIDSNALIHRFFHALPPFTGPDGQPTNALYGLAGVLLKITREQNPTYIAAAFDRPEATFRKEEYKEYKIHRKPTAAELVSQIIKAHEVFGWFGVKTLEMPGFEADDVIATLTEKFKKEPDLKIIILSGDLDNLQLIEGEKIVVQFLKTGITETIIYDEAAVEKKYGLKPPQLPDYKGFVGDVSDNIPGVEGIGPKTASTLLKEFGTVEEIFDSLGIIPNKSVVKKLEGKKEAALFSKRLATMRRDVPLDISLEELKTGELDKSKLKTEFQNLGFKSLIDRLEK